VLDEATKTVRWEGVEARAGDLGPARLLGPGEPDHRHPPVDRYVQFAADPDLFNRWEAGQTLARELILGRAAGEPDEVGEERYRRRPGPGPGRRGLGPGLQGAAAGPAHRGRSQPGRRSRRPAAIHAAREAPEDRIAVHLGDLLRRLHGDLQSGGEFSADARAAGKRALRNACCDLLAPTRTRSMSSGPSATSRAPPT
jgi:aminopeptidase N